MRRIGDAKVGPGKDVEGPHGAPTATREKPFLSSSLIAAPMPPAFLQVAIPVLYVYDEGTIPEAPPGFDMGLLPVISRALKEHANTGKVTVITGAPTSAEDLSRAFTNLGLQHASIQKASPEAGNLLVAEFVADHFDAEAVLDHLKRIVEERQKELAEGVEAHRRRTGIADEATGEGSAAAGDEPAEDQGSGA
jgi:hypothetical protein